MESEDHAAACAADIAAAIGEPARAKMLYCLLDGHARTSTELSAVADVSPSTASAHLNRLKAAGLIGLRVQGKHRYHSLANSSVAAVLESLHVLAGGEVPAFIPNTPERLRKARTCYDHVAGAVAVSLHDEFKSRGWLRDGGGERDEDYLLTAEGHSGLVALGVDVDAARRRQRRFAYGCVDWSERRPHLAGALGAALMRFMLDRAWFTQDLDSRSLSLTHVGQRQLKAKFNLRA